MRTKKKNDNLLFFAKILPGRSEQEGGPMDVKKCEGIKRVDFVGSQIRFHGIQNDITGKISYNIFNARENYNLWVDHDNDMLKLRLRDNRGMFIHSKQRSQCFYLKVYIRC